jgi:hypothetical protein
MSEALTWSHASSKPFVRPAGGNRRGAGRKLIEIDPEQLEKLCVLHCTDEEIPAYFQCTPRTIENRRKQPDFREAMERGRAKGRISLRRVQMKLAEGGNASMAIWLGKQLLGQRDVTPIELSGPNGTAVKFSMEAIDAILAQSENPKGR